MTLLNTADKLYVGSQLVDRVYVGAASVWTAGPFLTLTGSTVVETAAIGTTIGTLSIVGTITGTPVYTLTDSAGGKFSITGASLKVNGALDYETATTHSVTVAVSGTTPAITSRSFTIIVTDVDETVVAPTLALTSPNTDTTPDFTLTGDLALADLVRFQYSTASDFTGASELTNTIDAGEDAANLITFTTGALALGTWYFRARIERGVNISAWSNTVTDTIIVASTPVAITQTGSAVSATDLTTYTFTGVPLGAVVAGRMNIVGVAVRAVASVTIVSVSIDGVPATQAVYAQDLSDGNTTGAALWAAATPSANATGTVIVVLSAAAVRCGINAWKMTGAASVVPSATDTALDSPTGDISLTVPTNGAVCAIGCKTDPTFAWSGITQCLASVDVEGGFYMGAAMKDVTTGGANAMFLSNSSATANAAWGP